MRRPPESRLPSRNRRGKARQRAGRVSSLESAKRSSARRYFWISLHDAVPAAAAAVPGGGRAGGSAPASFERPRLPSFHRTDGRTRTEREDNLAHNLLLHPLHRTALCSALLPPLARPLERACAHPSILRSVVYPSHLSGGRHLVIHLCTDHRPLSQRSLRVLRCPQFKIQKR